MKLVKLGGSVITYKGGGPRFRRQVTAGLAAELRPFRDDLCLVHGGGSFGHPLARAHSLHRGGAPGLGFATVQRSMRRLNGRVLDALHSEAVPAVPLPPSGLVRMEDGEVLDLDTGPFREALEAGLVPVTFGDAVLDPGRGSAICSGDDLMLHLATGLDADRAVFAADVDGVALPDGTLLPEVRGEVPDLPWSRVPEDVTGGLRRKVELMVTMARKGCPCLLVNGRVPGRLTAALRGEEVVATAVRGS